MNKSSDILKLNSLRLRKHVMPFNPLFGNPNDPHSFFLNISGIRKTYLPVAMKNEKLIKELTKHKSLASFIRSYYFKSVFGKVSTFFLSLKELRLKYDFFFWIHEKVDFHFPFNGAISLIRDLQYSRWSRSPLNLIIRKNHNQDTSTIVLLFIIWFKTYSDVNNNVLTVSPSELISKKYKNIYLGLYENNRSPELCFLKTDYSFLLSHPYSKSKLWFLSSFSPEKCRGLDFSVIYFSDMGKWPDTKINPVSKFISAAFPVINHRRSNLIIIESGSHRSDHAFAKELKAAQENISPFNIINVPWFNDKDKIFPFDSDKDKLEFFFNLFKFRNHKSLPHFPRASGEYLYSQWNKGLPLEALHWFATESTYYKTKSKFYNHFPPV